MEASYTGLPPDNITEPEIVVGVSEMTAAEHLKAAEAWLGVALSKHTVLSFRDSVNVSIAHSLLALLKGLE